MSTQGRIRAGIGGWDYDPWRQTFFPKTVKKAQQLQYASRQLTAIEVNGTFYRLQKPETFAKWRDETPDDFVFALKAPRYIVNRRVLADASKYMERFFQSGLDQLGAKLGPLLWQFAPTTQFSADDTAAFLNALPRELAGRPLRHAIEVRHESFVCEQFIDLARSQGVAIVFVDSDEYPACADITTDFVYARLKQARSDVETGYTASDLDAWAQRARDWSAGSDPADLPHVLRSTAATQARDVFMFFINGAKERAPAAAMELISRVGGRRSSD
jgi:uncharacterized protein YecE (DUF72 family)